MALTQAEWLVKLKRWVPSWFLTSEAHNVALLNGAAKLLAERSGEVDQFVSNTFIQTAELEWLQLIGHERNVDLMAGETIDQYRLRIRNSTTSAKLSVTDIENIVQNIITQGQFWVHEDFDGSSFGDRSYFCNRRDVIFSVVKDGFTIFVDNQGNIQTLNAISNAVKGVKAFGCLFRLIERAP